MAPPPAAAQNSAPQYSWACATTKLPKNACWKKNEKLRTEKGELLLDILHRQQSSVIAPVGVHGPRHDAGKRVPQLRILRQQRLHDRNIAQISLVRIRNIRSLPLHDQIE